jgi:hypothetical protein
MLRTVPPNPRTREPRARDPHFKIKLSVQGARTATLRAAAHAGGRPIRKLDHG